MHLQIPPRRSPQEQDPGPGSETATWFATTIFCSTIGGLAIGTSINAAEAGVPYDDPRVTIAPLIGLVFTGLAIKTFDATLQHWNNFRQARKNKELEP